MKEKPNVSIIVLDTLKLDMFNRILSQNPNMAKNFNFVRFENCIAPGSWNLALACITVYRPRPV